MELNDDSTTWYYHGERHRENGPAIENSDGSTVWYYHGKLHRIDEPAVEQNGSIKWYFHGILYSELNHQKLMYYYNLYSSIVQELKM